MTTVPDRELRPEDFPVHRVVSTRWADNDVYGHLNNAVHYELFDSVINAWLTDHLPDLRSRHGVLGVVGIIGLLLGVGACFVSNQYFGLLTAVVVVALMPFAATLWVKVWPHTYAGRRLILGPSTVSGKANPTPALRIGQVGTVVSELRPGGVCEFGPERVEARCEQGTIPTGRRVEVVAFVDHRPLVRAV